MDDYEERLEAQFGVCAICLHPPGERRLAADHCHASGAPRALLCFACNAGLGQFRDHPVLLQRAAQYLRDHGSKE